MANLTYRELKERVSVIDVARYLGYEFDRSKGTKQPSYVLNGEGEERDRIYIKNPHELSMQGYWRRNSTRGGDVIQFVRENLDKFSNVTGYNEVDRLNKVLHNFANHYFTPPVEDSNYKALFAPKTFEKDRWAKETNTYFRDRIFESRCIDRHSSLVFSDHIDLIRDTQSSSKYVNMGFPYTIPGNDNVVGYEIRGIGGFKSKAAGTDSTNGMWIADFSRSPQGVRNIYVAESAFDAISYYQLNNAQIDLSSSAFVSFGGSFSDSQFRSLIHYYDTAKPNLLFDNDLYGHLYDIRAYAIVTGTPLSASLDSKTGNVRIIIDGKNLNLSSEDTTLTKVLEGIGQKTDQDILNIIKPQGGAKDWNEILQLEHETTAKNSIGR